MLPWNLIIGGLSSGFKVWSNRRREMSQMKHEISKQELMNGSIRAKRKWSLILDLFIGVIVLAPFTLILVTPFFPDNLLLVNATDYINNGIKNLPAEYWYLVYGVVFGNFGISLSNVLGNKAVVKSITRSK